MPAAKARRQEKIVTVQGHKLTLSNLSKVMYPQTGFTKAHIIDYYRQAAPYMLPHLKDRPISLKRFPDGVEGHSFFEKNCPYYRPDWIATSKEMGSSGTKYCLINDLATLIWIQNLGAIELHTVLAKAQDPTRPTMVVFDLDPGEPAQLADCMEVALLMRQMLEGVGLKSFPKTSGGKGLHFYVPLNTPTDYEHTRKFARAVARLMEKHFPQRVLSRMAKNLRTGKVFIDWSQNTEHKSTVCVYSMRARALPTVSMPLAWEEIENAVTKKQTDKLVFTADKAIARMKERGDLFEPVLKLRQKLAVDLDARKIFAVNSGRPKTKKSSPKVKEYRQKRNFEKTPEPAGGAETAAGNLFVIQKHDATRLHYDLRLEAEGVLKSWAVPKGPSSNPKEKRLAVRTEDHPLEYADFEGNIPADEYGGGQVIVWDHGRFENHSTGTKKRPVSLANAIENGKIDVTFHGEKIKGSYALVKMKSLSRQEGKEQWLLIKHQDHYTDTLPEDLEDLPRSVTTGRTVEDVRNELEETTIKR
ncbi:MAG: non-homologous end-joining DNA ligase [Planctomycetaceae bacterium]|nr:non-homologous end-joining DNA ligase [Planctomycetaceae bacterium]